MHPMDDCGPALAALQSGMPALTRRRPCAFGLQAHGAGRSRRQRMGPRLSRRGGGKLMGRCPVSIVLRGVICAKSKRPYPKSDKHYRGRAGSQLVSLLRRCSGWRGSGLLGTPNLVS